MMHIKEQKKHFVLLQHRIVRMESILQEIAMISDIRGVRFILQGQKNLYILQ